MNNGNGINGAVSAIESIQKVGERVLDVAARIESSQDLINKQVAAFKRQNSEFMRLLTDTVEGMNDRFDELKTLMRSL